MRLPILDYHEQNSIQKITQFGGYDRRHVIPDSSFRDMKNMSGDKFPAICTRKHRGETIAALVKPNGIFWKNGLCYVDGTGFYYNDVKYMDVEDSQKVIVGMGAYILVFPDKMWFNTNTLESGALEKVFEQTSIATFEPLSEKSVYTKLTCEGLDFKEFDSITITGCIDDTFNKTCVIQSVEGDTIVIPGAIEEGFTQESGLTIKRSVPDMDYVCENNNRLWGCSSANHEIYASKLGNPFNWNNFEGISTDAYAATVGSDGDFTGCIGHLGNVIFFKENTIHKLMGTKPSNFQINTYDLPGVAAGCQKSLCSINETLFYKGRLGVYTFDGSIPVMISDNFGDDQYTSACANKSDGKYYVTLKNSRAALFVYDPKKQLWYKEDATDMAMSASGDGKLYYVEDGNIKTISGDTDEYIPWKLISGDQTEDSMNMKYIQKFLFYLQLEKDTYIEIFIQYDDEPLWQRMYAIRCTKKKVYQIPIIPRRHSIFRYKIIGHGDAVLFGIQKHIEEGSEINGCI